MWSDEREVARGSRLAARAPPSYNERDERRNPGLPDSYGGGRRPRGGRGVPSRECPADTHRAEPISRAGGDRASGELHGDILAAGAFGRAYRRSRRAGPHGEAPGFRPAERTHYRAKRSGPGGIRLGRSVAR